MEVNGDRKRFGHSSPGLLCSVEDRHSCRFGLEGEGGSSAYPQSTCSGSRSRREISTLTVSSSPAVSLCLKTVRNPLSLLLCSLRITLVPAETASRTSWWDISPEHQRTSSANHACYSSALGQVFVFSVPVMKRSAFTPCRTEAPDPAHTATVFTRESGSAQTHTHAHTHRNHHAQSSHTHTHTHAHAHTHRIITHNHHTPHTHTHTQSSHTRTHTHAQHTHQNHLTHNHHTPHTRTRTRTHAHRIITHNHHTHTSQHTHTRTHTRTHTQSSHTITHTQSHITHIHTHM